MRILAERPGFEPGVGLPPQLLSRQLPSTTRPPLQCRCVKFQPTPPLLHLQHPCGFNESNPYRATLTGFSELPRITSHILSYRSSFCQRKCSQGRRQNSAGVIIFSSPRPQAHSLRAGIDDKSLSPVIRISALAARQSSR